jgi:hypothetical protein
MAKKMTSDPIHLILFMLFLLWNRQPRQWLSFACLAVKAWIADHLY